MDQIENCYILSCPKDVLKQIIFFSRYSISLFSVCRFLNEMMIAFWKSVYPRWNFNLVPRAPDLICMGNSNISVFVPNETKFMDPLICLLSWLFSQFLVTIREDGILMEGISLSPMAVFRVDMKLSCSNLKPGKHYIRVPGGMKNVKTKLIEQGPRLFIHCDTQRIDSEPRDRFTIKINRDEENLVCLIKLDNQSLVDFYDFLLRKSEDGSYIDSFSTMSIIVNQECVRLTTGYFHTSRNIKTYIQLVDVTRITKKVNTGCFRRIFEFNRDAENFQIVMKIYSKCISIISHSDVGVSEFSINFVS
jgi:hypothetical protein